MSERAVEELFATGIEDRILPVGAMAPDFALKDCKRKDRALRTTCSPLARWSSNFSAAAGAPIASLNSKPGATSTASSASAEPSWLRSARRTSAKATSWPASTVSRSRCSPIPPVQLAEQFGLVYTVPEYLPRVLPLHPRQHPVRQRRAKLAFTPSSDIRHLKRPEGRLRRGPRRFPRSPRTRRSPRRRLPHITAKTLRLCLHQRRRS